MGRTFHPVARWARLAYLWWGFRGLDLHLDARGMKPSKFGVGRG